MSTTTTLIHVRFAPDGTVFEIGERPVSVPAQDWFTTLSQKAGTSFESLSGGRGVFRLPKEQVDALKAASLQ